MKKISINGFGRIGRASLKVILETPELEVVAENDLMCNEIAAYLFECDSVYGVFGGEVNFNLKQNDKRKFIPKSNQRTCR